MRGSYRGWNTDASESKYCIGCTRTCKEISKHLSSGTHIIAWKLGESSPMCVRNTLFECTECRTERLDIETTGHRRLHIVKEVDDLAAGLGMNDREREELKKRRTKANIARRARDRERRCE